MNIIKLLEEHFKKETDITLKQKIREVLNTLNGKNINRRLLV